MAKYAVIRTDNISGTDQRADLLSVRFYDSNNKVAEVENGVIVKVGALESGEREVHKATAASSSDSLNDCAILAGVELFYDESRRHYLDEWINPAGKATRAYILRSRNLFSVTAEGFVGGTVPAVGDTVGIGTGGKIDASGSGLGVCEHIETQGRYTWYQIKLDKTEA